MPSSRIDILLNARDQASGPIKNVKSELGGLDKAAGSLAGGLGGLGAAAGIAGIVALGAAAVNAAADLSELGVKATMLRESFDALAADAGQSGDAILDALRQASQGAIADSDLILAANRAMLLGVADTGEEMAKLMEIAAVRGRAMGSTVSAAFNDIVTGLGRGSALILDNLGIVVNATEANEKYAASIGKTAEALSETEKKQALINAVLADTTSSAGATVNPFERLGAATTNLHEAIGTFINTATGFPNLLNSIADAADNATNAINEGLARDAAKNASLLGSEILRLSDEAANAETTLAALKDAGLENSEAYRTLTASLAATRSQLAGMQEDADVVNAVVASLANQSGQAEIAFQGLGLGAQQAGAGVTDAGDDFVVATGKIEDFIRAANSAAIAQSQAAWFGVSDAIDAAATASGRLFAENQGGEAGLARQKDLTAELDAQRELWRDQGYTIKQIDEVLLPAAVANIQDADRALFKATAQTGALKDAASDAERAFNDLKGKVEGVLQGALNLDVGVNPEDFLPRPDAIAENARRLADIMVNGFKGQDWLEEFKNEVPDIYAAIAAAGDPKTAAAQALKEFEAGLRPELIDKEAAKERVRQMLLGEQNLSELAQEIAAELADEMGVLNNAGLQSTVGQALGLRGDDIAAGLSAGQEYAEGAKSAVADAAPGTVMVATLNAQLRLESNLKLIGTAGNDTGMVWGDGFLAGVRQRGVPAALIDMLVSVVLPGVAAGLNTKATLEGAAP